MSERVPYLDVMRQTGYFSQEDRHRYEGMWQIDSEDLRIINMIAGSLGLEPARDERGVVDRILKLPTPWRRLSLLLCIRTLAIESRGKPKADKETWPPSLSAAVKHELTIIGQSQRIEQLDWQLYTSALRHLSTDDLIECFLHARDEHFVSELDYEACWLLVSTYGAASIESTRLPLEQLIKFYGLHRDSGMRKGWPCGMLTETMDRLEELRGEG